MDHGERAVDVGARVGFGRTSSGDLVGWPVDSSGAPIDKRVVMTRTRGGTLIGWPLAGVGEAPDKRLVVGRTRDGTLIGWALLRTAGGCPDLSAYSPVDKSFSDDFTLSSSVVTNWRFPTGLAPSVSGYYEVPAGKAWCVSDLKMKMTWISGVADTSPSMIIDFVDSFSFFMRRPVSPGPNDWAPGDVIDLSWPGFFNVVTHGYRIQYRVFLGNAVGSVRFQTSWTATEFDLASQA